MPTCTRHGCGKAYDADSNDTLACQYHPGVPKFHEGLKGWTCCKERVHSFDDFLEIRGCALGPHTDAKQPNANPFKADLTKYDDVLPEPQQPSKPQETRQKPAIIEEPFIDQDPEDAVIAPGTKCKRNGCSVVYAGDESKEPGLCVFHPGVAVFHEGTKGWSCCKRRETEFEDFLRIKGCAKDRHMFVGTKKETKAVKCRRDFYQIGSKVVVSVYAKKVDKESSCVEINEDSIDIKLVLTDGVYQDRIELFGTVDRDSSLVEFLSTKVEITLAKMPQIDWSDLEKQS